MNAHDFVQMNCRVFLCKDKKLTVIFQETETIGLENL